MSSMLEQAIIDADQLKETAKKTAEEAVVEKYQHEIKEAINKILEQDEPDLGLEEETDTTEMTIDEDGNLEVIEGLPAAQTADMEEVVEIDLNKLEEMMAAELEEGELDAADMLQREQVAEELEALTEDDEEVDLEESDLLELTEEEDLEEEIEFDEENLAAVIAEMLGAETEELEENEELEESDEAGLEEEKAELQKESKLLNNRNKRLLKEQKTLNSKARLLQEKLDKYGTVITKLKTKLNESSLTNAKLLYQNRILNSVSLNERQKDKIVEAISNANSVEEAKLIFETLQSAVGSSKKKNMSKSLNEVVSRSSSAFIPRKEVKPSNDAFSERMKRLAGLK